MRHQNFFVKIFLFFACLLSITVFAQELNRTPISTNVTSLDAAWDSRESAEGQTAILKFIQSKPTIPENFDIAWRISRLVYFIGNFGLGEKLNKNEHMQVFEVGCKAGEIAKRLEPKRVEGYYWYAINLGKYSLTKGIFSALESAATGRDALLEAAKLNPTYHWAGPYRVLGRYYHDLPSGISFGDKKKAREYYNKAIELAPEYKLNTVYLGMAEKNKTEKLKLFELAKNKPDVDGEWEEKKYRQSIDLEIKKTQ